MRKKIYSLVCAGIIMVAAAMQVQASEVKEINGVQIESADYNDSHLLGNGMSEGVARGMAERGRIIDTATVQIANLGKGNIKILIETLAHVECTKIKNIALLEREEDGKWVEVSRYVFDAKKEDFPNEDLSGMTNEVVAENQKTGYQYRVRGIHYVEADGKGQSFLTKTNGIMITEYGD